MNALLETPVKAKRVTNFKDIAIAFRTVMPYPEEGQKTKAEYMATFNFHSQSLMEEFKQDYENEAFIKEIADPNPYPTVWIALFYETHEGVFMCKYTIRQIVELSIKTTGFSIGGQALQTPILKYFVVVQDIFGRSIMLKEFGVYTINPRILEISTDAAKCLVKIIYFENGSVMTIDQLRLAMWHICATVIQVTDSVMLKKFMDGLKLEFVVATVKTALQMEFDNYGRTMKMDQVSPSGKSMFLKANQMVKYIDGHFVVSTDSKEFTNDKNCPKYIQKMTLPRIVTIRTLPEQ